MVKIGHASTGELGAKNNVYGDQTGKEVCTRGWYNGSWHTVLRCKDEKKAELMAQACEKACANANIGYDQYQRNTLRKAAKVVNWDLSKVGKCECDCSSLVSVCAECAEIDIPYVYENAPTTSSMVSAFKSTGEFDVLTESKYLTSDKYLKRGDILVKSGHTVMVLENGANAKEVIVTVKVPALKKGSNSETVGTLQAILKAKGFDCGNIDNDFGTKTENAVKLFQKVNGLSVDGKVGAATWTALLNV